MSTKLDALDYADDIALLYSARDQMQTKVDRLIKHAKSTGLNIYASKTKVMRINANNNQAITASGEDIEDVSDFIYLGETVNEDIRRRLGHARIAYNKLRVILNNSQIGRKTKLRLFNSNVISVLLYSCETWKMTKGDEQMIDTFLHKCLRRILRIDWPQRVRNETVGERAGMEEISTIIRRRRWRWIWHVLRMDKNKHVRTALTWTPEGKRKRGRPRETWRRPVERERAERTWLQIMGRCKSCSKGKDRMERSCSWPYSPQGKKEISQVSQYSNDSLHSSIGK